MGKYIFKKSSAKTVLWNVRVCRISNSSPTWYNLWYCGCLWSGLSPFIQILFNILWLGDSKKAKTPLRSIKMVSFLQPWLMILCLAAICILQLQGVSYWRMESKSALRGRRLNNFIDLWCLVASGGLVICVSSISYQKMTSAGLNSLWRKECQISVHIKNWFFDNPFYKMGLWLVIWVLGMIKPSGSVNFLMKWGCRGHRGHWGY